jgi:hydroxyacylglutathione hydrolase
LIGTDKAMMVDTGMSKGDLRACVEQITRLPISVVNTHGHFDHTGGNGWFEKSYMHPNAVKDAKNAPDNGAGYRLEYSIEMVTDGHKFNLGGRTLEVIEIPAHSPGSIAILDKENRMLFTGDELEAGQVLLHFGDTTVERHHQNMKKLKTRSGEFDWICPAHNGTPIDPSYLDAFMANDQKVLDGIEGTADVFSPSFQWNIPEDLKPFIRRSEYEGSAIIYDTRRIFIKR